MELIGPVRVKGLYGYLATTGGFAIEPAFEELGVYSEGLVSARSGDGIGFVDRNGSIRIPFDFEKDPQVMPVFRSGLAAVRKGSVWGYVDRQGRWQIPPAFDVAWDFRDAYALVETRHGYFVIDRCGETVTKLDVWDIRRMPDWIKNWNCFRCVFSGKADSPGFYEGCVNWRGETVFPAIHNQITEFVDDIAGFCDSDSGVTSESPWGLTDIKGNILRAPEYLLMTHFSEGLAGAARSLSPSGWIDEFGFIDTSGEWVIAPRFREVYPFSEGLARVAIGDPCNEYGEVLGQRRYGFIDRSGDMVIEATLSKVSDFAGDHSIGEREGRTIVLNRHGRVVWCESA